MTRAGEVLDRDGRLLVGPPNSELDLIPRRAELEHLQSEIKSLDEKIAEFEVRVERCTQAQQELDRQLEELSDRQDDASRELAECRLRSETAAKRRDEVGQQRDRLAVDQSQAERQAAELRSKLHDAKTRVAAIDQLVAQLETSLRHDQAAVDQLESRQKRLAEAVSEAQVILAKSEQRRDAQQTRREQLQRDQDARIQAMQDAKLLADRTRLRAAAAERELLRIRAELAVLFLLEEQAAKKSKELASGRTALWEERNERNRQLSAVRQNMRELEQRQHHKLLEAERLRHEREVLAERLREDYRIEVSQLQQELECEFSLAEQQERAEVDAEIADLRRKITNLGSVNMDALEELTDLESRYNTLSTQYQDLIDAKQALEQIIQRINADSRRLFAETLEAIRANFQVLFRKVFGGGSADIVMEQGVDILESGIDIVATPPGKHSLGLSLLSGGERALTAVTLLLAIFEFRPSPFCVLDEVDGPLDEANIGRFVDVLHEFLEWTKFVVVTHSKKTMTAANTLYGVTMQESGVSKRVSVRFEEVNEDGELSESALRRAADAESARGDDDDERGAA